MGVLISAFPQPERDLPDAVHAQLDALDIHVSDGNWKEHVAELFLGGAPDDIPAAKILKAAQDFVRYYDGKTGLNDTIVWHIGMAQKVIALATAAVSLGDDMVVAGPAKLQACKRRPKGVPLRGGAGKPACLALARFAPDTFLDPFTGQAIPASMTGMVFPLLVRSHTPEGIRPWATN